MAKVIRYTKRAALTLIAAYGLTLWPELPHHAADGVNWCAQTLTGGVKSAYAVIGNDKVTK